MEGFLNHGSTLVRMRYYDRSKWPFAQRNECKAYYHGYLGVLGDPGKFMVK